MANGRHARGAEHLTAHDDLTPAAPQAPGLDAGAPISDATPGGRRRRMIEEPSAPVTAPLGSPVEGLPRQGTGESGEIATGHGRRRRATPEADLPVEVAAEPVLAAPTGRRRRTAAEAAAEAGRTEQVITPVVVPGSGRRRRSPEVAAPTNLIEPATRSDAALRAEAPAPAPTLTTSPVIAIGPVRETVLVVDTAPVLELAPRSHRRAAAKAAPVKLAAAKAAPTKKSHAANRRKVVALPAGAPSGTALIAGAAAVAVAAAGVIGAMNSGSNLAPANASLAGASVLGLNEGGALVDSASVNREQARASRDLAREALADRIAAAAALQQKQEAAARALAAAKARAQQLALIAQSFRLPVSGYHLTAGFGDGGYRWSNGHTGLDFACAYGTPIHAVAAGTVIFTGWDGSYGWKTVIRHADGTETWYAHQSQILVRKGQVAAGQIIGRVGMTGNTTGPHLHLEVRINNIPINPLTWLRAHGLRP